MPDVGVWGGCIACIQGWPGIRAWHEGWANGACRLASECGQVGKWVGEWVGELVGELVASG